MTPQSEVFAERYRLLRPLAALSAGGCVYAAEHVFTRKPCALKLVDAGVSEKVRKRMAREMDALALVQGPGVVDFRDAGVSNGRPYLVLELLEGRTLAGLLAAKGTLAVDQVVRLGVDIADALGRCHARGVAHRDIKPANVFVTTAGTVQLLDFGIAKLLSAHHEVERLTQENTLVGTPEYMAPEALLLSPDVDERVDQYALGVTLYECLAGVVPFEGTYNDVLRKVSQGEMRPIAELRPDVPKDLADVIARALARDPAERFASIVAMRDALRAARGASVGEPLLGPVAGPPGHAPSTVADSPAAKAKGGRRRRHARAPYVTLARVRVDAIDVDGRVEEVSESGFQFIGARAIAVGAAVVVRFALPISGRIVETRATARWSRSARGLSAAGFEFAELPADALVEMRKYVSLMAAD